MKIVARGEKSIEVLLVAAPSLAREFDVASAEADVRPFVRLVVLYERNGE